jgi:hypothetical protein
MMLDCQLLSFFFALPSPCPPTFAPKGVDVALFWRRHVEVTFL